MNDRKSIMLALCAAILAQIISCAASDAPSDMLPDPANHHSLTYGGWITVYRIGEQAGAKIDGELIAVDSTNLYLLTQFAEFITVPLMDIEEARLTAYDIKAGQLGAWVAVGLLSTLTHGLALIGSAPAWILLGALPVVGQSFVPRHRYPEESWESIRQFARFPQGLPPGMKLKMISRIRETIY